MTSHTEWLKDCRHPSSGEPFSLPNAIYFLIKFRADLAHFKYKSIKDRMVLYFWWNSVGKGNYPDFQWVLRPLDVAYIQDLDTKTLLTEYQECIAHWLRGASPDVLEEEPLVQALMETEGFMGTSNIEFPRFLNLIIRNRPDLHRYLTLDQFPRQLASLDWWEKHGQFEYPKITWSSARAYASLNQLEKHESYGVLCFPRFLPLILESRSDLKANIDLSTLPGQLAAVTWWERHGQKEYPNLTWSTAQTIDYLNEPDEAVLFGNIHFPHFLPLVIKHRADLKDIDLTTFEGRLAAVTWWEKHGRQEYPNFTWSTAQTIDYLNEPDEAVLFANIHFPHFLPLVIKHRADLKDIDLTTFPGQLAAINWWNNHGQQEYPDLVWSTAQISNLLDQMDDIGGLPDQRFPRFLPLIIKHRPDLQRSLDLRTAQGQLTAIGWWETHGKVEFPMLQWSTSSIIGYFEEFDKAIDGNLMQVPRFVTLLIDARPDLQQNIDIATFTGQVNCLQWWQNSGVREYPYLRWATSDVLDQLVKLTESSVNGLIGLPRFLLWIRDERPDLQTAFDVSTNAGRRHLVHWWQGSGRNEYRALSGLSVSIPNEDSREEENQCAVSISPLNRARPFGINIVGFPQGVLGLGEDARTAARALTTASIPSVLVNAPMIGPPKLDMSISHLLSEDLKHSVSLFCLPPPEMLRLSLEGGRKIIESDTYKIGSWPWELPQWPSAFGKVHTFVDELWAQSKFVQTTFARQRETPVYHMPMAVEVPPPAAAVRSRFKLPENTFLFYLMFDGNSWLTRKNPVAGVRAFQEAFGSGQSGVGLVVKAMNIREDDPIWREVADIAAQDSRVHLISERLTRQDTIDFMACCDAYISLHRSEGFGRVIAEAMAIGQPVVVTNFSGNVDFCNADTSYLVDGELVPLRQGDYLFHEGQYWCDPDVSTAARQLVRVLDDANERERIAAAGTLLIRDNYSIEAVGRAYAKRLAEIRSEGSSQ
ncbi:glycosyltransferase family 4 protein [Paraburkholderia sp. 40]|uniref:glycosyltransferase family 4 protein n=1 Tax=Paraburkholderia sp. 40 TaxID=2991059 RepID=UPI003D239529